jgi:hypothetical protein
VSIFFCGKRWDKMGKDGKRWETHPWKKCESQWTPINSRQKFTLCLDVQINVQCLVRIPQMKGAKREIQMASWTWLWGYFEFQRSQWCKPNVIHHPQKMWCVSF